MIDPRKTSVVGPCFVWLWEISICFTDRSAFSLSFCFSVSPSLSLVSLSLSPWLRCCLFFISTLIFYIKSSHTHLTPPPSHIHICISRNMCKFLTLPLPCNLCLCLPLQLLPGVDPSLFCSGSHSYNWSRRQTKPMMGIHWWSSG